VDIKDVPEAAAKVIQKAAEGAEITAIAKEEIRAEAGKDGKLAKLDKAKTVFEAELKKGGQVGAMAVAPDGTVAEALAWKAAPAKTEAPKADAPKADTKDAPKTTTTK
jgi:hypothetical protein